MTPRVRPARRDPADNAAAASHDGSNVPVGYPQALSLQTVVQPPELTLLYQGAAPPNDISQRKDLFTKAQRLSGCKSPRLHSSEDQELGLWDPNCLSELNAADIYVRDLEREAEVKRELFVDYGKLSPDERRAEALARFAEHGHFLDPSVITCTADEWAPSLLLPDGRTIVRRVDPSATTTADLVAEAADFYGVDAADIRLLDRYGERLGTADGVALPRDEGGKRHRLATPGGVALARTDRVGPDDTLHVMLSQEGGVYSPNSPSAGGVGMDGGDVDGELADEEEEVVRDLSHARVSLRAPCLAAHVDAFALRAGCRRQWRE